MMVLEVISGLGQRTHPVATQASGGLQRPRGWPEKVEHKHRETYCNAYQNSSLAAACLAKQARVFHDKRDDEYHDHGDQQMWNVDCHGFTLREP